MSFTTDYIAQLIETRQYDTIAIYSGNGQESIDYATGGPQACLDCLELFVQGAKDGQYQAHLYFDGKQSGSGSRTDKNRKKIVRFAVGNRSQNSGVSGSSIWIEKFIDAQQQINELRTEARIREVESKTESVGIKMFDAIMEMQKSKDQRRAGISGPSNENSDPEVEKNNQELAALLTEWQKLDPDFFESLRGLVKVAKEDPAKYNAAKSML